MVFSRKKQKPKEFFIHKYISASNDYLTHKKKIETTTIEQKNVVRKKIESKPMISSQAFSDQNLDQKIINRGVSKGRKLQEFFKK